jgi:hypothetical protein
VDWVGRVGACEVAGGIGGRWVVDDCDEEGYDWGLYSLCNV